MHFSRLFSSVAYFKVYFDVCRTNALNGLASALISIGHETGKTI